jgi:hypothetical protein
MKAKIFYVNNRFYDKLQVEPESADLISITHPEDKRRYNCVLQKLIRVSHKFYLDHSGRLFVLIGGIIS